MCLSMFKSLKCVAICHNILQQAGAELGQAQVILDDIVVIVLEVVGKAMVEV